MQVRIWRSFASNNSSSYRLIARFRDAASADAVRTELEGFLADAAPLHERRHRSRPLTTRTSFPFVERMDALAAQHGFDWTTILVSGVYDDELEVLTEGSSLLVYHPYCLGLGDDIVRYLRAREGEIVAVGAGEPILSVFFHLPSESPAVVLDELASFFARAGAGAGAGEGERSLLAPPWSNEGLGGIEVPTQVAFFFDGKTVGFALALPPEHFAPAKAYLHRAGVVALRMRVGQAADLGKLRAIGGARCSHCDVPLEFLDKDEHSIEADQLACGTCGGMFGLEAFGVP